MTDIRAGLRQGPMTRLQIVIVALCVTVNMIDGFDVLAAAFTAPSLSEAWSIRPQILGYYLGSGPVGMALGALILGPLADVLGRRRLVLLCVGLMGLGMLLSAGADNLTHLILMRILTGLGIGGALASANTMVAEYASDRRRSLAVSVMSAGYPIGATVGGLAAIGLLQAFDWRAVFVFGGVLSLVLLPFIWMFLPESLEYLAAKRTPAALRQVNVILARLGKPPIDDFPPPTPADLNAGPGQGVFGARLLPGTVLICLAYFCVMLTFYFVIQWTPKMLVDAGLSTAVGVSGGTLMNLGGILGAVGFGVVTGWIAAQRLAPATILASFALLVLLAFAPPQLEVLLPLGFVAGVFMFASMTSLFAVVPLIYPARVRGAGTGVALGLGRVGAILGPIVAGYLIEAGLVRWQYIVALSAPLLVSALAVARAPLWKEDR